MLLPFLQNLYFHPVLKVFFLSPYSSSSSWPLFSIFFFILIFLSSFLCFYIYPPVLGHFFLFLGLFFLFLFLFSPFSLGLFFISCIPLQFLTSFFFSISIFTSSSWPFYFLLQLHVRALFFCLYLYSPVLVFSGLFFFLYFYHRPSILAISFYFHLHPSVFVLFFLFLSYLPILCLHFLFLSWSSSSKTSLF